MTDLSGNGEERFALEALIARHRALPMTHVVVTRFTDGREERHETRSAGAAENWAIGERRKIGRRLLSRQSGQVIIVESVRIEALG